MASGTSDRLHLEEQVQGENSTTWGDKQRDCNRLLEEAIAGVGSITHDDSATYVISIPDQVLGSSSATNGRNMILEVGGTLTAQRILEVPTEEKLWFIYNNTGQTLTVQPNGASGIDIPDGKTMAVYCDGTNVVDAIDNLPSGTTVGDSEIVTLTASQTLTSKTLTSPVMTGPIMSVPQIHDTSSDHQYVFAVSELAADRTVTLPLLAGNDEFVFKDFIQTLTNKTLTAPTLTTPVVSSGGLSITSGDLTIPDDIVHAGDTNNLISFGTDTQDFQTGGSSRMDISDTGLRLGGAAARVTEFSTDGTLAGDSDTAVPTEKAVKTYADGLSSSGGLVFLTSATASNDTDVSFSSTHITSTYDTYVVVMNAVRPASDGDSIVLQVSTASTFNTGASDYDYSNAALVSNSTSWTNGADTAHTGMRIQSGAGHGFDADETLNGVVYIYNPSSTSEFTTMSHVTQYGGTASNSVSGGGAGAYLTTEANDGIRFKYEAGNITSGVFYLYGVSKT